MKLILGLGMTGFSIASFLNKHNINYKIADSNNNPKLLVKYNKKFPLCKPILGKWDKKLLIDVDEIFISPGIEKTQSIVVWANNKGIPITSDIELFSRYANAPVIGITGSNGKSTVTKLLADMIINDGKKAVFGGNIGIPALDCLSSEVDYYVLEISSFQLDYTNNLNLLAAVVLNITPDHLNRYKCFDEYKNSKLSLYKYCKYPVFNLTQSLNLKNNCAKYFTIGLAENHNVFGTIVKNNILYLTKGNDILISANEIKLIGKHNILNILAALALSYQIGLNINNVLKSIKSFVGLEHRLELFTSKKNIDYYNDSQATSAIATISAIKTISQKYKDIVLIAGGTSKPENYSELYKIIDKRITCVILIGKNAYDFALGIKKTKILHAKTIKQAVYLSNGIITDGAILLSPACASFDMFDNSKHRGDEFKKCVLNS